MAGDVHVSDPSELDEHSAPAVAGFAPTRPVIAEELRLGQQIITRIRDLSLRLEAPMTSNTLGGDEGNPLTG